MCLPKRCERLKTYFIIILSSTCAPVAASPICVRRSQRTAVGGSDSRVPSRRKYLRLYLMAVIVHGRLAVSNARRMCRLPDSDELCGFFFFVHISYLFGSPLDISYNFSISFRQIYTSHSRMWGCKRHCDMAKGPASGRERGRESQRVNCIMLSVGCWVLGVCGRTKNVIIMLRVRRTMIGGASRAEK